MTLSNSYVGSVLYQTSGNTLLRVTPQRQTLKSYDMGDFRNITLNMSVDALMVLLNNGDLLLK